MTRGNLLATSIVAICLGVGVYVGIEINGRLAGLEQQVADLRVPPTRGKDPAEEPPEPRETARLPLLGAGDDLGALRRRLDALEAQVAALGEVREAQQPLLDLYAKWKEAGLLPQLMDPTSATGMGTFEDAEILSAGPLGGADDAQELATKIGLEGERAQAFQKEYASLIEEAERLEKAHATVTKEGDTTTIRIEPYPSEGDPVRRRWRDFLDRHLTQDERGRYDGQAGDNRLLGNRLGGAERTITIREADGTIRLSERTGSGDGAFTGVQMEGPAIARDFLLVDYDHLLD